MDLDEIKKRENEQYFTFQCNVRQMCKDVLAKLEEQESVIADKDAKILALDAEVVKQKHHAKLFFDERNYAETQLRHNKYKRCLAMAMWCDSENYTACWYHENSERCKWTEKWHNRWLKISEKFKEAK